MRKTNSGDDGPEPFQARMPRMRGVRSSSPRRRYRTAKYSSSSATEHGHDAGDGAEEEEQRVHPFGRGRGLLGEQRYVGKHFKAPEKTAS